MATAKVEFIDKSADVIAAVKTANFKNFNHAAARIRKDAIESIIVSPVASPPGTPPHTRRRLLKNAIVYSADDKGAVIGPRYSRAGTSGSAHEFGGVYKRQTYPERPFMAPALMRNLDRFAAEWEGSVGE
jgi:hypothetical protein